MVFTHGIHCDFRGGVHLLLIPPYAIGLSRVYRAMQLRTDGVYCCRESAGRGQVVLKEVPVNGFAGHHAWANSCAPLL